MYRSVLANTTRWYIYVMAASFYCFCSILIDLESSCSLLSAQSPLKHLVPTCSSGAIRGSTLLKDTWMCSWKSKGVNLATFWLLDDPLHLLSHSHWSFFFVFLPFLLQNHHLFQTDFLKCCSSVDQHSFYTFWWLVWQGTHTGKVLVLTTNDFAGDHIQCFKNKLTFSLASPAMETCTAFPTPPQTDPSCSAVLCAIPTDFELWLDGSN